MGAPDVTNPRTRIHAAMTACSLMTPSKWVGPYREPASRSRSRVVLSYTRVVSGQRPYLVAASCCRSRRREAADRCAWIGAAGAIGVGFGTEVEPTAGRGDRG